MLEVIVIIVFFFDGAIIVYAAVMVILALVGGLDAVLDFFTSNLTILAKRQKPKIPRFCEVYGVRHGRGLKGVELSARFLSVL